MALPSQFNLPPCWRCGGSLSELTPLCPSCQALQNLPETGISHFSILGVPVSLLLTEEVLRSNFYERSKLTHPDKFSHVPPPESSYALRWSTAINKAYQTLRDPQLRSIYLLQLYEIPENASSQVPVELAETYFELQELLMEDEGESHMQKFREALHSQMDILDIEWQDIAEAWEKTSEKKPVLEKLRSNLNKQRYLTSMLGDLDRKIGKKTNDYWN